MRLLAALLLLGGCALDEGHIVNVSPSAEGQREIIEATVEHMNELAGETAWWVRSADNSDRRDGEIIVRQDSGVRVTEDGEIVHGKTRRTSNGVIIWIPPKLSVRGFAHELGHAGGLEHVGDRGNLMYKRALEGEWTLTEKQLEQIR